MQSARTESEPMNGYRLEDGDYGVRMTLTAPWRAEFSGVAQDAGVVELYLNYSLGWKGDTLDWLENVPGLLALQILAPDLKDIRGLNHIPQLRRLRLEVSKLAKFDLGNFTEMEEFSGFWVNSGASVFQARLRRLRLIGYPVSVPAGFAKLRALQGLALYSGRLESLGDISEAKGLHSLCLAHCDGLRSLKGIEGLHSLRELILEKLKGLEGIQSVASLKELKTLVLDECGPIPSLSPLRELQKLETLRFTGSTSVTDGDLMPVKGLSHLKNLGFVQRKHYNLSWRSLPRQLFESRYEVAWS